MESVNCKRVYRAIDPFADNNFLEFQGISELQKGLDPFAFHRFLGIPGNCYRQKGL